MKILILVLTLLCNHAIASTNFAGSHIDTFLNRNSPEELAWVKKDLIKILKTAKLETDFIGIEKLQNTNESNQAFIKCENSKLTVQVHASEAEWSSTFYKALRNMGFLFPHPERQISPDKKQILSQCEKTIVWEPRFPVRGFHLHNQHPTEWIEGLYLDNDKIMGAYLSWLKRNQQNLVQVQKIRVDETIFNNRLADFFNEAYKAKVISSLSISFSLYQQKSHSLLPIYSALTGINDESFIRGGINKLRDRYKFQILTFELGTTEFTSAPYAKTLKWLEVARDELEKNKQMIFTKIHASTGQSKKPYGNFNYLPQYSHKMVGILPHTVMAYSLLDKQAPLYGLDNFDSMRNFLVTQSQKRPTIYYPETSYYISMDIDVPLFLTDYLISRSEDMDFIEKHPTWGQVNFTTGMDMGYWLMDWTVALLADKEHAGQSLIGLKLLGEDLNIWKDISDFQTKHFKKNQLLQKLSFANLQDELNFIDDKKQYVHFRKLIRNYFNAPDSKKLNNEISKLKAALAELPDTSKIISEELRLLVEVTFKRIEHALNLRLFLNKPVEDNSLSPHMKAAKNARIQSQDKIRIYKDKYYQYPNSLTDNCKSNPTSYDCGYGWTGTTLYHWERQEEMVEKRIYNPFYKNFYSVLRILL